MLGLQHISFFFLSGGWVDTIQPITDDNSVEIWIRRERQLEEFLEKRVFQAEGVAKGHETAAYPAFPKKSICPVCGTKWRRGWGKDVFQKCSGGPDPEESGTRFLVNYGKDTEFILCFELMSGMIWLCRK